MKLTKYERPGVIWPTLGRLAGLQDELDRLFESPLTGWAPALDVQAAYKDGVLTVTLPKGEEAKPKQIDVSVN